MADVIKYGSGRGIITITGEQKKILEQVLKAANIAVLQEMERELESLKKSAQKNWPVRQVKKDRSGKIRPDTISRGSAGKFATQLRVVPPAGVLGSVINTSPYAYAIRSGADSVDGSGSDLKTKVGVRVADSLVFWPARKGARRLAKLIADTTIKKVKRG